MESTYKIIILIILIYSAYTDIRTRKIMMMPIYACMLVSLINMITDCSGWETIAYGALPGVVILLVSFLTRGSVGDGDAYLFIVLGMLMGIRTVLSVMTISMLAAAVFAIVNLLKGKLNKKDSFAFAPFILTGYLGVLAIA